MISPEQLRHPITPIFESMRTLVHSWRPSPNLWDSRRYFSKHTSALSEQEIQSFDLQDDLLTLFDEYASFLTVKIYPYGPYGLHNRYSTLTSQLSDNFQQALVAAGQDPTRAQLETSVARQLEQWMTDTQTETAAIITTSPRGTLSEGYPGETQRNYNFVNVLLRTLDSPTGYYLIQYLNYLSNDELASMQQQLVAQGGQLQEVDHINKPIKPAHALINQLIKLPNQPDLAKLAQLTQPKTRSNRHLTKHPQLDPLRYATARDQLIAVLSVKYQQLTTSQDRASAAHQFDVLVTKVALPMLKKWVETQAENYHDQVIEQSLDLAKLDRLWELEIKRATRQLTPLEKQELKGETRQLALDVSLPMARLSLAHCVVGTPPSLLSQASGLSLNLNAPQLAGLSLEQTRAAESVLNQLTLIWVHNQETNVTEPYYILLSDQSLTDEYLHSCYRANNQAPILGPCHVPLSEDSLLLPILGQGRVIDQATYFALQQHLAAHSFAQEIAAHQADVSAEDFSTMTILLQTLIQLFCSVNLSNLIAGVIECDPQDVLPAEMRHRLITALNPIPVLTQLIAELDPAQHQQTVSSLMALGVPAAQLLTAYNDTTASSLN